MQIDRKVAQDAYELLDSYPENYSAKGNQIIKALHKALQEPEAQAGEPVGYHFSYTTPFGHVVWAIDYTPRPDAIEVYPLVRAHPTTERPYNPLNDYAVIPMNPTEPVKAQAGESRKTVFEQALDEVMETGGIFPTTDRRVIPEDAELLAFAADEQFFLFCEELEVLDIMRTTLQKYLNAAPKGEV